MTESSRPSLAGQLSRRRRARSVFLDRLVALLLTWAVPGSPALALTPRAVPLSSGTAGLHGAASFPSESEVASPSVEAAETATFLPERERTDDDRRGDRDDHGDGDHDDDDDDDHHQHRDDEESVQPILECVVRHSSNSYTAYFGFKNETNRTISIPVGSKNAFSPSPQNRNQPTSFAPGRSPHYPNAAVAVPFNGSTLSWTLRGPDRHSRTATARSSSPRCQSDPGPTPTPTATPTPTPVPTPAPGAGACVNSVFGPRRYTRTCGGNGPTEYNQTFTIPVGATGPYTLRVVNGDAQGRNKTSSAEIRINGVEVARESDFSQNVITFTKPIATLNATNQLYVKVKSSPGSTFTIEICGSDPGDTVPPSVEWLAPLEDELLDESAPLLRVRYQDLASSPNLATLKILVDGVDRTSLFVKNADEASAAGAIVLADGPHTLHAEIRDQAGNLGVANRAFRVDATLPVLASLAPAPGAILNAARPPIRVSFSDPGTAPAGLDPDSFAALIDGVDITSALTLTEAEATGLPPAPLANGPHQFETRIADLAGNLTSASSVFTIDTVAPVLNAVSPAAGQVLGANEVGLAVQYSDNQELNLDSFTASVDGSPVSLTVDADSAYGTAQALADGPHALVVTIADRAGNVSTATRSFSTDTGRPVIAVVTPPNGVILNRRSPEILVTFSDAQGLAPGTLKILVNGLDRTGDFAQTGAEARATLPDPLPEGVNTIAAEVQDNAGNLGSTTAAFTVDVTPPTVVVEAPISGAFLADPTPSVSVVLSDALSGVEPTATRIFVDDLDVSADFAIGPDGATGTLSNPLAEGPHTLRVVTADLAANPTILEVPFTLDLTPPTLEMAAPRTEGFTNDSTPEIWIRTTDPVGSQGGAASGIEPATVRVFLLSEEPGVPDADITALLSVDATDTRGEFATVLADGSHRLRAVVRDRAGNEAEITAGFVVDTQIPAITIDQPQSDTFLSTAEPTIVLVFGDDRSGIDPELTELRIDGVDRSASLVPTAIGATLVLARSLGLDLADGSHQITARVVDRAGNAAVAAPANFGVDTVLPTAEVLTPLPQSFIGAATPALRMTIEDAAPSSGIDQSFAQILLDGVDITAGLTFTVTGGGSPAETVTVEVTGIAPQPLADGVHTLRLTAIDNANNPVEVISQFTVDTLPPVVIPGIPEGGQTVGGGAISPGGAAIVTGALNDADPGLVVTCSVGGVSVVGTAGNGAFSCAVPVAEGVNEVTVTVADSTGHTTTSTRSLTVDRVAPVVTIDSPSAGEATAAEFVSVSGHVEDATAVTVTVNGIPAAVTPASLGVPATFLATNVPVGAGPSVVFTAVATDGAANTGEASVTVAVDRTPPAVTITRPAAGAYLKGGLVEVEVEVVDRSTTLLEVNGVPGFDPACSGTDGVALSCVFTLTIPLIGDGAINATVIDGAGNVGRAQTTAIIDSTPPTIVVTSPVALLVTNAVALEVAGMVTDTSPVTLTVDGQAVALAPDGVFSVSVPAGSEGPRDVVLVATDAAGNQSTVTVPVVIDRTPPALTIASPLQGAVIPTSSLSVAGTVLDGTVVSVTVAGVVALVTGQAYSASLSGLSEGPLSVVVRAVDAAGNVTELTRDAEIDLGPPTVTITSPAPGTLTREATAILAYTVLDRSVTTIKLNDAAVAPDCPGVLPCDRTQSVDLVDGDNTFTIEATDAGGRATTAQVTITRDSIPPLLDLVTAETVSRSRPGTASASATDNLALAQVEIRLGATLICTGTSSCAGPIPLPETARAGDSLTITGTATDTAGNVSTTTRTVRVTTDGVVTGTVLDDRTSLPIEGASVTLMGATPRTTTTDPTGRYNLPVSDTTASLHIEKAGMTAVDRVVTVASGVGTVPLDARLTLLASAVTVAPAQAGVPHAADSSVQLSLPEGAHRVTPLSPQGLPNLLPLGFSPLGAFDWTSEVPPTGPAQASIVLGASTLALPEATIVRYDPAMRDWRIVATGLVLTSGALTADLATTGTYAVVIPDEVDPGGPGNVGAALVAALNAPVAIPATATSEGRVDPAILPPTGGTATGSLRLDSPSSLPSGTVVQADVEETYTLATGEEASAPKRSMDVLVFRTPAAATGATCAPTTPPQPGVETFSLCGSFAITPSRTYANTTLREGRVHLDLLAGRENARGVVGGNAATTVATTLARLNVAAGSLAEDTAIALYAYDSFSPFIPDTNGIMPLGEATVDLATATLNTSAQLTFLNVAATPGDTLVVARVDRAAYDGIPRLQVVALAEMQGADAVSVADTGLAGVTLEGIKREGRYVLLRLPGPIGWVVGSTYVVTPAEAGIQTQSPVRALVRVDTLPFVATSTSSGYYAIPSSPGSVTVTARVLGQSLVGGVQTTAVEGTPTVANIALEGTVTQATITPASGAVGVEVNEPLTLTSPVSLDPTTVTTANINLRTVPTNPGDPATTVPLRLVLSGSGKQLAIIPTAPVTTPPTPALSFSTNYILEVTGLLDTVGGLVTAPTTTFRTKDDIKPVYDLKALTFSFPDAEGLVTVSAPNDTFPPGTEILIINSGNGVVLGLTAGNDGEVNGTLPASLNDRLFITVTDPFGNTTNFESSTFKNAATGETAVGPGGGTIEGPEGTALQIPAGALAKGVAMKLEVLTPEQYDTQFPNQRPAFGDRPIGTVLKITAAEPGMLLKPAKLTFSVPSNFETTYPGADPKNAVFYTLKRSVLPDGTVAFEVIDHAFAVCPGDAPGGAASPLATCDPSELRVKTASPPLPEFTGNFLADTYILLTFDFDAAEAAGRSALAGAIVGRVRRQAYGTETQPGKVTYEPVPGARVFGSDASGNPLKSGNALFTTTQSDGTYTLWDPAYTGGTVRVHAELGTETGSGLGFEGNPQDLSSSWGPFPTLRFYRNKAHVDVLFETQQPRPPAPDVSVVVMDDSNSSRTDTRGIATAGTPLRIGFKSNRVGESVSIAPLDINGQTFTVVLDTSGQFDRITQDAWTPAQPGTYLLRTTATAPISGSIPVSATVRIVAAGGGIETDNTQAPRVLEQRTYPKPNARNVQTGAFPSIAFSEPVVGLSLQTVRLTRGDIPTQGPALPPETSESFKITAITAAGQVIDDITLAPTLPVTAITVRPLYGLKYKQRYTLSLTDGIQDLDTENGLAAPKSLVPYTTSFDTFGPEAITPEGDPASYTTTGFYVAKNQADEPLSMWALKHQILGANWITLLTGYDVSDPINVVETTTTSIFGRPMDVVGEGTTIAVATAPGARSIPSNVRLYDVNDPAAPAWVGSATLASTVSQGSVNRITMRGNRIYAGTFKRGIQIVDVDAMRAAHVQCCTVEYFKMQSDLNLDGLGFNQEAVIATIPVSTGTAFPAFFTGIKSIAQGADALIAASGSFGLALAKESSPGAPVYQGKPEKDGDRLEYGTAIDAANVGGYDIVVVAGVTGGTTPGASGSRQVLMTIDVTNPQTPVVLGVREVATALPIVDVLVNGTTVYVSTQGQATDAGAVEVFDISDTANIAHLGTVAGVAGRLAIAGKLLYGATTSTFGAPIDGFGGVRTAALGTLALIEGTYPPVVVVGEGPQAAEAFSIKYRVIPSDVEVQSAQIEYVVGTDTTGASVPVTLGPTGRGDLPVNFGFTFPKIGTAVARPRLSLTTTEGVEVVGPARALKIEQPTVELAFDDDQEEEVTADRPEVGVRVSSAEWYRRYAEARDRGQSPPASRSVNFASISPGPVVSPAEVSSRDGIFETSLASLTVPSPGHQVRASVGSVTLGVSDSTAVVPGPAASLALSTSRADLPLDGASEALITLEARDNRGNLVLDGTGVFWETDGDGEFVEPLEATSNGVATVKYRAGDGRTGPVTITARVDDVEQTAVLQQHAIQVLVTLDCTVAYIDTPSIEVTATVTSQGGAISPNAGVSVFASAGKITSVQPLSNGQIRARWESAGTLYRYALGFSVAVAEARGQSPTILWRATRTPQASGGGEEAAAGSGGPFAPPAPVTMQGGETVRVASTFPGVIAGDKTQDGEYALELPNGTTRNLPYTTQSTYRITGLTPGERVGLTLGSGARPNAAAIVYYSGTQGIVSGQVPDDLGRHDAVATAGVQATSQGAQGGGYSFDGTGVISVPHAPAFAFSSGFMVQAAVRPPPTANGVIFEKAGEFRLDLVNGHPRFALQTGAAIGSVAETSITLAQSIPANEWTLLAAKVDGATIKLIAGGYEETGVLPQARNTSVLPIVIGAGFTGSIDEIRAFDLAAGPLLTFAGGATEVQGVADASGNFETVIQSGGSLVASTFEPTERIARIINQGRLGGGLLHGGSVQYRFENGEVATFLQDPAPTATQETLSQSIVDVNAFFADSAQTATTPLGVATSDMLARAFLVIGGIWGAGPPDDPYVMAGDLVLGTILQAISTPRDLVNAFDHARKGQADKFEALTIAAAAAGAAAVVFSKKAAILGKFRRLPRLLTEFGPAAEANRVLGKRLLKGIKEVADDLPGGKTLENVAEAAETISTQGRQALSNVLNAAGDRGRTLDKVETIVKNAPDKEGVIRAMDELRLADPGSFKAKLGMVSSCAIGAAAADVVGETCSLLTPKAIKGVGKLAQVGGVPIPIAHQALNNTAKANRTQFLERIQDFAEGASDEMRRSLREVIRQIGSPRTQFFRINGAKRVMDYAYALRQQGKTVLPFEEAIRAIDGLGRKGRRFDMSYLDGAKRFFAEVKNWDAFPPTKGLQSALEQMGKDLVITGTNPSYPLAGLRWVFKSSLSPAQREKLVEAFAEEIKRPNWREAVVRGLQAAGRSADDAADLADQHIASFLGQVGSRGLFDFVP